MCMVQLFTGFQRTMLERLCLNLFAGMWYSGEFLILRTTVWDSCHRPHQLDLRSVYVRHMYFLCNARLEELITFHKDFVEQRAVFLSAAIQVELNIHRRKGQRAAAATATKSRPRIMPVNASEVAQASALSLEKALGEFLSIFNFSPRKLARTVHSTIKHVESAIE